jgi:asparagine synthase (glutamine-hydrolysing)
MCGIAGIFNIDGKTPDSAVLKRMTDVIAHRGPDGEGHYVDAGIALGHRRLAIIDLSDNARQPMSNEHGRLWLTYNGEIYNFMELRKGLEEKGHIFKSNTDSEVILHGYEEEGIDYVSKLNGMFAFALWDASQGRLFLVRDRYGIKPLYYKYDGKHLVFGSEIKAILQHPEVSVKLNYDSLNEYFSFQNLFQYHTLFDGINLVPQANILTFKRGAIDFQRRSYWDYNFTDRDELMTEKEAKEETLRLLRQAIKRQLVADVPVGSYLSGGMDSGSIVAVASETIPRMATFTCGFDMSEVTGREANFDERRDAELVASHYRTEHYEQVIGANDLEYSLPKVIYHLEDLRMGMCYPNYYISRLSSKFVKVCLSGAGGDELYAGYPWRYYRSFRAEGADEYFRHYYEAWQRLVLDDDKHKFFSERSWSNVKDRDTFNALKRVFTFNEKLLYNQPEDHIANSLYFEIKTFLHGLFIVQDKLAMANGLEERVPFLDNDLVDFAQRIPIKHKLKNLKHMKRLDEDEFRKTSLYFSDTNDGKNCLRNALSTVLPENVVNRRKQGFSSPDESWYRGEGIAYVRSILFDKKAVYRDFINPDTVQRIIKEHCELHVNHRLLIWSLLCFEWWCRIYLKGEEGLWCSQ